MNLREVVALMKELGVLHLKHEGLEVLLGHGQLPPPKPPPSSKPATPPKSPSDPVPVPPKVQPLPGLDDPEGLLFAATEGFPDE